MRNSILTMKHASGSKKGKLVTHYIEGYPSTNSFQNCRNNKLFTKNMNNLKT